MKKNMSSFSMYTLILLSRGKRRARARKSNVSLSLSFMYNFRSLMFSVQRVSKQIREVYKWYVEQFPCTKEKEKKETRVTSECLTKFEMSQLLASHFLQKSS